MNPLFFSPRILFVLGLSAAISLGFFLPASGQNIVMNPVYEFTNGIDGATPKAPLVLGNDGYYYGTTATGGASHLGTIFQVSPDGTLFNFYSFSGGTNQSYPDDGASPIAALVQANDGYLYGTTYYGGASNLGTIFKLSLNGGFYTIYSFTGTNDGAYPRGALVQGRDNNFYGTTSAGGAAGFGTVFKITGSGIFSNLYSFTGAGSDGAIPYAGLAQASNLAFYGTTSIGGTANAGTVFQVATNGAVSTIYSFTGGNDGDTPQASLIIGSDTNFYGTTYYGGTNDYGNVFQLTPAGQLTTLYSFKAGLDGYHPTSALLQVGTNFYGTTLGGGSNSGGIAYRLNLSGQYTNLYTFTGTSEGYKSYSSLVLAGDGSLLGTTSSGGSSSKSRYGAVYRFAFHPQFFAGEIALNNGVYYLAFTNGNLFGYYNYNTFPILYHYDLGFSYFFDAQDAQHGAYLYDFTTAHFWYTSPQLFPYLYDFTLNAWLYYYIDTQNAGHYTTNPRYFYNFGANKIITQ